MLNKTFSKTLITLGLLLSILLAPASSFAQSPALKGNQTARLSVLHTICDNRINLRIDSLNSLNTRVGQLKKLSQSQIASYQSQIQTDISGLNTLKAKCDADTDLTTLRADVSSIFKNFRVYALFMPQVRLLAAADKMSVTADNLSSLYTKLQARVSTEGNPSNLTALLSDMNNKINDAKTQYSNVESQVTPLTPSDFPGSSPVLKNARNELKTGAQDLKAAAADAKQIIQALKISVTSTPSPTP